VPILLGTFLLSAKVDHAARLYAIVVVIVTFSVIVQGGLVPTLASLLGIPMRTVELEPWALGVRLRNEPDGVQQLTVAAGSPADGRRVAEIADLAESVWLSFVVRNGQLLTVNGETQLRAGDYVLALADADQRSRLAQAFGAPT
jgi:cell volume regulation protein A